MKVPPMTPALQRVLVEEEPVSLDAAAEMDAAAAVALHSHAAAEELLRAHSKTLMSWVRQYGGSEDALGYALVAFTEAMHITLASGVPLSTALQSTLSAQRWTVDRETPNTNLSAPAGTWRQYRAVMRKAAGNVEQAEALAAERGLNPVLFRRMYAAAHPVPEEQISEQYVVPLEPPVPDEVAILDVETLLDTLTEPQRAVVERMCGFIEAGRLPAGRLLSDRAIARDLHIPEDQVAELRVSALAVMRQFKDTLLGDGAA